MNISLGESKILKRFLFQISWLNRESESKFYVKLAVKQIKTMINLNSIDMIAAEIAEITYSGDTSVNPEIQITLLRRRYTLFFHAVD